MDRQTNEIIIDKAAEIKLLLTDVDGVLTDNGVYYSANGEELKKFSIRDGMGVERLKKIAGIETGIVTGEISPSVILRAEKLNIKELHIGIKNKIACLDEILLRRNLELSEIAFIGDDVNDIEVMQAVGLSACPSDAMKQVEQLADYVCENKGGNGAFREFAEFLLTTASKQSKTLINENKLTIPKTT